MKHAQRLLAIIMLSAAWPCLATNYYIDSVSGDDGNSGTSQMAAWETLANINTTTFQPGDSILFKAGQSWTGTIKPQGSGSSGNPIVIGMYGSGSRPALNGDGSSNCTVEPGQTKYCTILLYNQEYWVIRDLEITNYDSSEESSITLSEWESDNETDYANVTNPGKYTGTNTKKCGVLVQANDVGELSQLHFINLEVHGVNGQISQKHNGGIFFRIFNFGSETPTYFDDILIEDCYIHDVDRTGISNESDYDNRTLSTNTDWTPTTNLVIRNTSFERTGANALIVRVADNAVIENCHFDHCSIKESGNAAFNFNTDNTIWQYNEFEYTKANVGDHDAGGVDSDYRTKGTIIQYNYLHDNDFGMLVTGGPGDFNDGTIVRYNIFERDGQVKRYGDDKWFVLRSSGAATNTTFHNNVIYLSSSQDSTKIVFHKGWSGSYPDNTSYYNNIFYNLGSNSTYEFTSSTDNLFAYNTFYGNTASNVPTDNNGLTLDPLLSNPGGGDSGYELGSGSPALGSGIRIASIPDEDYYQNEIATLAPVDRGVHQVSTASTGGDTLYVNEDAHIRGGSYSSTNYGSEQLLTVKESSNASFTRRTLLKFDLTSYSAITSAHLFVYGNAELNMNINAYKASSDTWTESTVNWSNAPSFTSLISAASVGTSDGWIQLDVTSAAQDEMTGNGTFSIGLMDDAGLVKTIDLYSKENTQSQYKAYLVVAGTTITAVSPGDDAYVRAGTYASTNYGSEQTLAVKGTTNVNFRREAFLKFDMNSLGVSSVASAVFNIYGNADYSMNIDVYKAATDSWSESTVTYNSAPGVSYSLGDLSVGTSNSWYTLDIGSAVNTQLGIDGVISIKLSDDAESGALAQLYSSENTNTGFRPYLEITLNSGARMAISGPEVKKVISTFKTYPNPTSTDLNFQSESPINAVSIYDLKGREVKVLTQSELVGDRIDLSGIERGIYMIRFTDVFGHRYTERIIKY